jgi:hypothetical protein
MNLALATLALLAATLLADPEAEFLSRLEQSPLLTSSGKPLPRVERDPEGHVIALRLTRMQLTREQIAAIANIPSLKSLSLDQTNVTNEDLRQWQRLPDLKGISLSSTEITDGALEELQQFPALSSVCLGNVNISPESVAQFKDHFRNNKRKLSIGYTRRKHD